MKSTILTIISVIAISAMSFAQSSANQSAPADTELGLSYDMYEVVLEWDEWKQTPTAQNAWIGNYIEEFDVPTSGQNGLGRKETWFNWVSHHQAAMDEYLVRRSAAQEQ